MLLFLKKIGLFCLLLFALSASGQVRFTASVNPAVIDKGEFATIRFVIENADNVENISPPSFKNFELISGPMQESGMANINGNISNYLAISFVLRSRNSGKFTFPGAVAKISGKDYKSNKVGLTVTKTRSTSPNNINLPLAVQNFFAEQRKVTSFNDYIFKSGEDPTEKAKKNMHLKVDISKNTCYVGEPVVATYKLYTRLKSESKLTENPSFNGFSVIDLQADISNSTTEKLNGREYNVYTIRKAQLYPLQDGRIDLESAEMENKIQFIRESYATKHSGGFPDVFENFASAGIDPSGLIDQTVSLRSQPVSINVKPLPEKGKPSDFKGAVGDFNIETGIEKDNFEAGTSGKLIVMISGTGNLQLLTPPQINWPEGVEGFEPKSSDIFSMTSVPLSGKKVFEYSFTVDKPGNYSLAPIQLSFFEPSKEVYKTVRTGSIPFTVTNRLTRPVIEQTAAAAGIEETMYNKFFRERKWLIALLAAIVGGGLLIYIRRTRTKPVIESTEIEPAIMAAAIEASSMGQVSPLEGSEKCLKDPECIEFYSKLMSEIRQFLSVKFSVAPDQINNKSISEKMDKMNISNDTVLSLQRLLQEIEWQLYTPFERNEKMEILYSRSHEIIQLINTYDIKSL